MKYHFKFLLTNGTTEYLSFQANDIRDARNNAVAYGRLAYAFGELYEIVVI